MSSSVNVITSDLIRDEIRACREEDMTYEQIGRLYRHPVTNEPLGRGVIWNFEHGTEPTSYRVRLAFGLEPRITPEMYNEVRVCSIEDCDVPFVPNSPLRTKCFECSPYKKRVINASSS